MMSSTIQDAISDPECSEEPESRVGSFGPQED